MPNKKLSIKPLQYASLREEVRRVIRHDKIPLAQAAKQFVDPVTGKQFDYDKLRRIMLYGRD